MKRDYTSIRLEVTSHCNLKCEYCHNAQYSNQKDDLTTAEILMLIRNLKERYDIKKVLLTGGEPLTKTDICTIIYEISRMGIKADMVTNGTLITEEKLKELETAGLKRIRISIDEVDTRTDVRGDSNPNELWEKARMVVEKTNIELCVHTVCSPYNIKKLFDVYKKVLEIMVRRARDLNYGSITLASTNCRPHMLRLAIKYGFDIYDIKKRDYGEGNKIYFRFSVLPDTKLTIRLHDGENILRQVDVERILVSAYKNNCREITFEAVQDKNDEDIIRYAIKYCNSFIHKPILIVNTVSQDLQQEISKYNKK